MARSIEAVEADIRNTEEDIANVRGEPCEVYTRIVGYYRSVRNWNKGKREEYGMRRMYNAGIPLKEAM